MKQLRGSAEGEEEDPEQRNNIVFNATSEFCRTLGDIPTYGLSGNREDREEIMVRPPPPLRAAFHLKSEEPLQSKPQNPTWLRPS